MSPKAAFYILTEISLKARDLYACRIIEKAYSSGQKIYVYFATQEEAQGFDTQLWTFRDISFVPHEIYNQNPDSTAPVLIGYDKAPTEKKDVLVNFSSDVPVFYKKFSHIIEVVPNDDAFKALARKKYQTYQQQGCQMETFNIKA